jgi:hypothetical protein
VVTVRPGKAPGRRLLIVTGRSTWATQGAAEYVATPAQLAQLGRELARCPAAAGGVHPDFFQIVLRIEIRGDVPVSGAYVTHHDLP